MNTFDKWQNWTDPARANPYYRMHKRKHPSALSRKKSFFHHENRRWVLEFRCTSSAQEPNDDARNALRAGEEEYQINNSPSLEILYLDDRLRVASDQTILPPTSYPHRSKNRLDRLEKGWQYPGTQSTSIKSSISQLFCPPSLER